MIHEKAPLFDFTGNNCFADHCSRARLLSVPVTSHVTSSASGSWNDLQQAEMVTPATGLFIFYILKTRWKLRGRQQIFGLLHIYLHKQFPASTGSSTLKGKNLLTLPTGFIWKDVSFLQYFPFLHLHSWSCVTRRQTLDWQDCQTAKGSAEVPPISRSALTAVRLQTIHFWLDVCWCVSLKTTNRTNAAE